MADEKRHFYECDPEDVSFSEDGWYLVVKCKEVDIRILLSYINLYGMDSYVKKPTELKSVIYICTRYDEEHIFEFKFSDRHKVMDLFDKGYKIVSQILQSPEHHDTS